MNDTEQVVQEAKALLAGYDGGSLGHHAQVIADLLAALDRLEAQATLDQEHLTRVVARAAAVEAENESAHRALDDFDAPRTEPHFRSPYKLSGRIRSLRSTLVVEGNQRAGKLIDELTAAEAQVRLLTEALSEIAEADTHYPAYPSGFKGDWEMLAEIARAALASPVVAGPASPSRDSAEQAVTPEGFVFVEGDARCGHFLAASRATCLLVKGHAGSHRNTQGFWANPHPADHAVTTDEETTSTIVIPDWARRHDQHCPANQGGACIHEYGCPPPAVSPENEG